MTVKRKPSSNNAKVAVESSGHKKRTFKAFSYRGVSLENLRSMSLPEFCKLLPSKLRRKMNRGLLPVERKLIMDCAALTSSEDAEAPKRIDTFVRNLPIVPQMIGLTLGVYNGKIFVPLEIKPEMLGFKLRDFTLTRNMCEHGRPGVGATSSSKFVPLK